MADEQSPTVEIAPTIIMSNSSEGENNEEHIEPASNETHADGNEGISGSELVTDANTSENVAIAAIEAERDITLGALHSDVERERIELERERIEADAETNEEYVKCQREIQELRERVEALSLLIPPPVLVEVPAEQLEIAPETNSTLPSTAAPTVEQLTENSERSEDDAPILEVESRGRRFIAI